MVCHGSGQRGGEWCVMGVDSEEVSGVSWEWTVRR